MHTVHTSAHPVPLLRRDVMVGPKEERCQTRDWAVAFLAYGVVAWLAEVVEQLQTPGARVPSPRCAVDPQFIKK